MTEKEFTISIVIMCVACFVICAPMIVEICLYYIEKKAQRQKKEEKANTPKP